MKLIMWIVIVFLVMGLSLLALLMGYVGFLAIRSIIKAYVVIAKDMIDLVLNNSTDTIIRSMLNKKDK